MKCPFCPSAASEGTGKVYPNEDRTVPGATAEGTVPTRRHVELPFSAWRISLMGWGAPVVMENGASHFAETTHLL